MGIFGNDKEQDERIDALETHIRILTETVQANQADLVKVWITILTLKAKVDEKVSASDVDPEIVKLNQDLATARAELDKASAAATESWGELQGGVRDAFQTLRTSVNSAYDRLTKE